MIVGTGLVAAGQLAEDLADSPPLQMLPPTHPQRWLLIGAVLYMLASVEVIQGVLQRSLTSIRRVVKIDAAAFRGYTQQMRHPNGSLELGLLVASAAMTTFLFAVLRIDLLADDPVTRAPLVLPTDAIAALLVLAGYSVVGWAVLRLVVSTVHLARVLRRLSREPLDINVYDTTSLLPLGNVALAISMAPAGVIVILLLALGQPRTPLGWTALLLATAATVLALLLPLRGIHREMVRAKSAAMEGLSGQIRDAHETLLARAELDATTMSTLNDRTSTLIDLRRTVQEMPTWPFRDTVTFGRAVLIASAPLVYTVLSELIRVFWIAPLSR